ALAQARVTPDTIGYIEAHGTGTALGDPIEAAAMAQVFRCAGGRPGACRIGAVKTNVGHLDAAAGIAGLIKTILALRHELIPPTLHFEQLNPSIDFAGTPFCVDAKPRRWLRGGVPRRAGVSSFGIGGTNAHVVLEEAPAPANATAPGPSWHAAHPTAKSAAAEEATAAKLAKPAKRAPAAYIADDDY